MTTEHSLPAPPITAGTPQGAGGDLHRAVSADDVRLTVSLLWSLRSRVYVSLTLASELDTREALGSSIDEIEALIGRLERTEYTERRQPNAPYGLTPEDFR